MTILRNSVLALLPLLAACATPQAGDNATTPTRVAILAINDFHGALEMPRQSVFVPDGQGGAKPVPAGGAAWLASAMDSLRAQHQNHLVVSAGDLIGASQLSSALFLDEPTIEVMNRIGLDFNAAGNHEFDRGREELLRMQAGGCQQHTARKPCQVEPFKGAKFRFLTANTVKEDGSTLFPGTAIRSFGTGRNRVDIGLIGLTLEGTNQLVSPDGIRGLSFADEAETINAAVPRLRAAGADAIVVVIHEGVRTEGVPNPQGCEKASGDLAGILDRLEGGVDVVVSGHTHWDYICEWPGKNPARPILLTSAGKFGMQVTEIALEIDPRAGVTKRSARNVIVQSDAYVPSPGRVSANTDEFPRFAPRPDIAAYVGKYAEAAKQFTLRSVGRIGGEAMRGGDTDSKGGTLGHLIADAQLAATAGAGAQIAFMNPFGIRAPWRLAPNENGQVTFGDIYRVQPFGNVLITQTLTGAELRELLEQNFDGNGPNQVLSPSRGFTYSYDLSRPVGSRIVDVRLDGQPIDPATSYRVTTSDFLASGGDTYSVLLKGRDKVIGTSDIAALEAWLQAIPARPIPQEERTTDLTRR
ncbi:MAG: bifunctional metallophosphatase/5'-nucleotidase [Brevundimonas sp.]|jgi:5'-nucleotidase|nr:bifunctional metallophosphatase/5'-nucleotidase [Brevundimonas sp.]